MKTKKKNTNLVENGKRRAEIMWGVRVKIAVFPLNRGKYKLVYVFRGKETVLAGTDREKLLDLAFNQIRDLLK